MQMNWCVIGLWNVNVMNMIMYDHLVENPWMGSNCERIDCMCMRQVFNTQKRNPKSISLKIKLEWNGKNDLIQLRSKHNERWRKVIFHLSKETWDLPDNLVPISERGRFGRRVSVWVVGYLWICVSEMFHSFCLLLGFTTCVSVLN